MILGFSGTCDGMSEMQKIICFNLMCAWKPKTFHHGMCVGADEEAHGFARELKIPIVGHPPEDRRLVMTYDRDDFIDIKLPRPYLVRNREIVALSSVLIATPKSVYATRNGGTWYTIKFAVMQKHKVFVIAPDGIMITEEML